MQKLVTKNSLQALVDGPKQVHVIGRALVSLLDYQTRDEQETASTNHYNGVGFTGADAYSGTLTAKYYMKHGTLLDWQVKKWTKRGKAGYSRLAKYHRQLNVIANSKLA